MSFLVLTKVDRNAQQEIAGVTLSNVEEVVSKALIAVRVRGIEGFRQLQSGGVEVSLVRGGVFEAEESFDYLRHKLEEADEPRSRELHLTTHKI